MTFPANSKASGTFAACILLLSACSHARDDAAAPVAKPDHKAVATWLDRSEKHAASLPEEQLVDVLPTICSPMVGTGEDGRIDRLLGAIKDPIKRAERGVLVCSCLAFAGKYDAAMRRAQSLSTERRTLPSGEITGSWSDGGIFWVALAQSVAYEFADAKKTIQRINDPIIVASAYGRLAENQAKAGLYADAEQSLGKIVANTEEEKEWKEDTRKRIANYKVAGRKYPPRPRQGTFYESLRLASTIFSDRGIKLDNVAQAEMAEKAAEQAKGPQNKAMLWRNIAWAYYDMRKADEKNLERCRRAIDKSLQNAEEIPDGLGSSYSRAVAFASAANLYLELGEIDLAQQAVRKAGAVNLDADMLGGLSGITTTPLLIAVLVRSREIDGGREIAEKLQKAAENEKADVTSPGMADLAWLAWATACALEGKTANVERLLETANSARKKTVLCAGVAAGLLELQQQPEHKKP